LGTLGTVGQHEFAFGFCGSAGIEMGALKLQGWTMTDEMAGMDIDGRIGRNGHCRTANINGVFQPE